MKKRHLFRIRLSLFLSRLRKKDVLYINGADVLPRPLSPEEEAEAILHVKDDPAVRATFGGT